jgi:hypothetical protein
VQFWKDSATRHEMFRKNAINIFVISVYSLQIILSKWNLLIKISIIRYIDASDIYFVSTIEADIFVINIVRKNAFDSYIMFYTYIMFYCLYLCHFNRQIYFQYIFCFKSFKTT